MRIKLWPTCPTVLLVCMCACVNVTDCHYALHISTSVSMCTRESPYTDHMLVRLAFQLWHPPACSANNVSLPILPVNKTSGDFLRTCAVPCEGRVDPQPDSWPHDPDAS